MYNYRIATIQDLDFILKHSPNTSHTTIQSLITLNTVVISEKDKVTTGYALGSISLTVDTLTAIFRCIDAYGASKDALVVLLDELECRYTNVAVNKLTINKYNLNIQTIPNNEWYYYSSSATLDKHTTNPSIHSLLYYDKKHLDIIDIAKRINVTPSTDSTYYDTENLHTLELMESKMTKHYDGVWSMPVLSKAMCTRLLAFERTVEYSVNSSEEYDVQIPEVILKNSNIDLYNKCKDIFTNSVYTLSKVLYMKDVEALTSIQFAKYESSGVDRGNWHFDRDSDVTLVINLSDDSVECEGTVIKPFGSSREIIVPMLPKGHGLLFRGKYLQHKGLPVTKGTRKLLVFWSN